jgi:hypothetical protein
MGYKVPTFNITCNIWDHYGAITPLPPPSPARLTNVPCQLTWGHRVQVSSTGGTSTPGILTMSMSLLLAKLTDVRGPQSYAGGDLVEVPAGTGRWYQVVAVDDVGRGFTNEYRCALIFALAGSWAAPYP